jgi:hypothetical protein
MKTTPDYELAAAKACETLIKYGISSAPIVVAPIFQHIPGVVLLSFEELSGMAGVSRESLVSICGEKNQDAVTSVNVEDDGRRYVVAYNQRLPVFMVQRALARELGHIVLGHDGSLPEEIRSAEATAFAQHFLCPRPLIHTLQSTGIRLTVDVIGNLTGFYDSCLHCLRRQPAVHVPADLNRAVRDQFMDFVLNYFHFQKYARHQDVSALADLGTYLDGYEE